MDAWRYWQIWAGIEWVAAAFAFLYILGEVLPRLGFFVLSAGSQTVVVPQNRIWATLWLAACSFIALALLQKVVLSAPSYFARFFQWQSIDLYDVLGAILLILIPSWAFGAQASYLRILRRPAVLQARLSGWFGVLPFTQRIALTDISSLRAGHVTTRTTSNTQSGVHISSQTRYELILSGSFGARRLQFGSAEARDLALSVIQELKREHGSEAQELADPATA